MREAPFPFPENHEIGEFPKSEQFNIIVFLEIPEGK